MAAGPKRYSAWPATFEEALAILGAWPKRYSAWPATSEQARAILGEDAWLEVEGELARLQDTCAAVKRTRSLFSMANMRAIRQFAAALRRANRPNDGLPEDMRLLLGLNRMLYHVEAYAKVIVKPKPDAYAKRLAADAALRLCERFGIKPTTTKRGRFCKLAAMLSGDREADLQYYCRAVLKQRA